MYNNKAIFFDRDGVINKLIARDSGFFSPRTFNEFDFKYLNEKSQWEQEKKLLHNEIQELKFMLKESVLTQNYIGFQKKNLFKS